VSAIERDADGTPTDEYLANRSTKCHLCSAPADAYWHGHEVFMVCKKCAIEVLPALIADAAYRTSMHPDGLDRLLDRVARGFWRASALAGVIRARSLVLSAVAKEEHAP
jgi:hypothetical protein